MTVFIIIVQYLLFFSRIKSSLKNQLIYRNTIQVKPGTQNPNSVYDRFFTGGLEECREIGSQEGNLQTSKEV